MKILALNHTATMSGGERVLMDLIAAPASGVEYVAAIPTGPLLDELSRLGVGVRRVPGTSGSLRLHPVYTSRALLELAAAGAAVRRIAGSEGSQVLHANSPRAGLSALLARRLGGPPVLTHLHDGAGDSHAAALVSRVVARSAVLVANSSWTASSFASHISQPIHVVHNPVDLDRFAPATRSHGSARASLGIGEHELLLLHVAQITPWKGQDDSIRILAGLRSRGLPCRLVIAGSAKFTSKATRFDNPTFEAGLRPLARELGVSRQVTFLGEHEDTPSLYKAADLLLLPSWAEPYGLVLAEAMAMGTLVAATSEGGTRELLLEGAGGLLLPPRKPARWVEAIEQAVSHAESGAKLAAAGCRHVRGTLSRDGYGRRMAALYGDMVDHASS